MTSTNSKKSPVAYDPDCHVFLNHDAQHGTVQFCAVRGKKDEGQWVTLEAVKPLTPEEVQYGAQRVLTAEMPELLEIPTCCVKGVDDRMFRRARIKSKQLRWAYRSGRTDHVFVSI